MDSDNIGKIIAWAKIARAIYVPVNCTGGGSVKVNRKDFIALFTSLENFDGTAHFSQRAILYL